MLINFHGILRTFMRSARICFCNVICCRSRLTFARLLLELLSAKTSKLSGPLKLETRMCICGSFNTGLELAVKSAAGYKSQKLINFIGIQTCLDTASFQKTLKIEVV